MSKRKTVTIPTIEEFNFLGANTFEEPESIALIEAAGHVKELAEYFNTRQLDLETGPPTTESQLAIAEAKASLVRSLIILNLSVLPVGMKISEIAQKTIRIFKVPNHPLLTYHDLVNLLHDIEGAQES